MFTFRKQPDSFTAVGAQISKSAILVCPPHTGKSLLAEAMTGDASVSFFSIFGSEFVEMSVCVGSFRARAVLEKTKENAQCILFTDEMDAVGRRRGTWVGGGNNERE